MLSYANVLTEILQYLQDTGAAIFASAETQYGIENELKHLSRYSPQVIDVIYTIESRTGTDVTGTASSLTDLVKLQFVAGDATQEKVVHNTDDHTWAVVLANSSPSVNTLSADIMDADEKYAIYNKRCRNNKQIYIGDMPSYLSIKSVEYPIGIPRNYTRVSNDVIELEVYDSTIRDSDSTLTTLNQTEVLVKFAIPHVLCQLTDLSGQTHTEAAAGATTIQVKYFTDDQIIEIGDQFNIENHMTTYIVTTGVTLDLQTSTGKPISFFPGLEAVAPAAEHGSGITFKKSSLTPEEENYLIRLVSARACISKSTLYYAQVNTAITQCTDAATAIGDVAALIELATTATTGDIAKGRASTVLGATAITAIAAIIAKAEAATTGDIALGRAEIVKALTAITLANTEFDLMNSQVDLGVTALASGASIVNTIPIAGGAAEYMGQAASNVGASQGFLVAGQSYLQEASADLNNAASDLRAASTELDTSGAKAREATANFSNAGSHFNAAATDLRAAGEKANEAISNLRLVSSRLQVAQGGLRFEEFGRRELAQVESELKSHAGYPTSKRYPRE